LGIQTHSTVEIAAPPAEVFEWITHRDKLKAWTGVDSNLFPEDPSELRTGYHGTGTMPAPDGPRPVTIDVSRYDPPHEFDFTETYAGGNSVIGYKLTESGSGTALEMHADTDVAAPAMQTPQLDQMEQQIDHLPFAMRMLARHQMEKAMELYTSAAASDANAEALAWPMQQQVDAQMQRLKSLIEVIQKEKQEA
jgi:uncharacterized protein YndB with AHSA1/START domain